MLQDIKKITESVTLIGAIIALIVGVITIIKDTPWYAYTSILMIFIALIIVYLFVNKKNKYSDFDILNQEEVIDLTDYKKNVVYYNQEVLLKSLKHNAQNIKSYLHFDGTFHNPNVERGKIETIDEEGRQAYLNISAPYPIEKGKTYVNKITCEFRDSFNSPNEYWEIVKYSRTTNLKLTILFPDDKKPISFKALTVNGLNRKTAKTQPKLTEFNRHIALTYEVKSINPLDKYRIEWSW